MAEKNKICNHLHDVSTKADKLDQAVMHEVEDDGTTMSLEAFVMELSREENQQDYITFTIHTSKELHRKLAEEAKLKGVTLNDLCLYKLAIGMRKLRHDGGR